MTITIADRRSVPEASTPNGRLAFKNADTESAAGQMLAVDELEGIVTAVVSVTGVEDEVADIIEPGAYKSTLMRRRPKVCWAHSWEQPIGKVLYIEELLPGDERLPVKTRDGRPWPAEAGALVATMQFNMKSQAGREAFEAVQFYSESGECEYSIGYQVPPGKSTRDKAGVRHIKALELYELSVVLFGAHTMTGTLSIKAAVAAARQRLALRLDKGGAQNTGTVVTERTAAAVLAKALADTQPDPTTAAADTEPDTAADAADGDEDSPLDFSDGVMVAVYPDPAAADAVAAHIAGPDDTIARDDLHVTLAYLGTTSEVSVEAQDIIDAVTAAVEGMPVLEGEIGGIGQFPDTGDGAPTWAPVDVPGLGLLREAVAEALGDDVASDHGFTPHMTLGYDIGLIDPVPPTPVTFSTVRVVFGNQTHDIALGGQVFPDGMKATLVTADPWYSNLWGIGVKRDLSAEQRRRKPTLPGTDTGWPIGDREDLRAAVQSYGRAPKEDRAKVKRWIIRRARELNATDMLPEDWNVTTKAFPVPTAAMGDPGDMGDIEMDDFLLCLTEDDWEAIKTQSDVDVDIDVSIEVNIGADDEDDEDGEDGEASGDGDEPGAVGQPGTDGGVWYGKAVTPGGREGDDSPVGTPGGRQNWVDKTGGLPRYIRMVAHALMRRGMAKARAIATAVATMKRWAAGAGDVTPKVQAAAAAALAEWEKMRAEAHAKSAVYDPALETKDGAVPAVQGKGYPFLAGSYEERLATVRDAVNEALRGDLIDEENRRYEWDYVDVAATWPDRVIASRHKWGGGNDQTEHYEMTYLLTEDGVDLGDPQQITLQVVAMVEGETDGAEPQETDDFSLADAVDLPGDVLRVAWTLKASKPCTIEGKAGRVLSGRNERALREAVERLVDVLAAAGVQIATDDDERRMVELDPGADADARREMDPGVDLESTAPDAQIGARKDAAAVVLSVDQIAADLADLGLARTT